MKFSEYVAKRRQFDEGILSDLGYAVSSSLGYKLSKAGQNPNVVKASNAIDKFGGVYNKIQEPLTKNAEDLANITSTSQSKPSLVKASKNLNQSVKDVTTGWEGVVKKAVKHEVPVRRDYRTW